MAKPTTFTAGKLYIHLETAPGPPQVFAEPCGLTTRGVNWTKTTNDISVPDCDDPDAPVWLERGVTGFGGEISGSGVLAAEALPVWWDAFVQTESINAMIGIDAPVADNGGSWQGKVHVTGLNITGEIGNKVAVAVTIVTDGEMVWVDAAAMAAMAEAA